MNHYVGVSSDRGREVSVQRDVEGVVRVLGDVEHSSTEVPIDSSSVPDLTRRGDGEVLGSLHRLGTQVLQRHSLARVGDGVDRLHERSRGGSIELNI